MCITFPVRKVEIRPSGWCAFIHSSLANPLGKLTGRPEKLQVFCFSDALANSGISVSFEQQGEII